MHVPEMTPTEFKDVLLAVIGQPMTAAGYVFQQKPLQWQGGLFRFRRQLDAVTVLNVDYQLLLHVELMPRFEVRLTRAVHVPAGGAQSFAPASSTLAQLLWDVFGVRVLPARDHWWQVHDTKTLGDALLESGKLLVAYGLPWLDGSLVPGEDSSG